MKVVTPARVCLFGDHQDYLGLPIIACAINRYMTLEATPNTKGYFDIQLPDIGAHRIIHFEEGSTNEITPSDFILSAMKVVKNHGCSPFKGYDIRITSNIPINAGVSSSSALVVSWVHFLLQTFGPIPSPNAELIGQLAYEAEVLEHQGQGGKMDQYSIALGHLIYLETEESLHYELFDKPMTSLILVDSGIPKETQGTLGHVRTNTEKAVTLAKEIQPSFQLSEWDMQQVKGLAEGMPLNLQPYLLAAVQNHQITQQALEQIKKPQWNLPKLGELMNTHHGVLRDWLKVSHPKIDSYIDSAMEEGAYGGKIVGSGGGGCAVLLTTAEKKESLIDLVLKAGAKAAYEIEISSGTHVRN